MNSTMAAPAVYQ